jgi:acetyl esterase/lipase
MPNPQLAIVLQFIAQRITEAVGMSLDQMREQTDAAGKLAPPLPGVDVESTTVAGLRSAWFRPADADPERALLFLHGGGYLLGSIDSHRDLASRVALAANAPTLVVEYRRAPEAPFPAGLDDAVAAYRWMTGEAGLSPSKIAFVGDSAGGGLCLGAALRIRDADDLELPGALACMSPWTDLSCGSASLRKDEDPSVKVAYVEMMARAYLAGRDAETPEASPLYADAKGLPPVLLQVGSADALHDDSQQLATRWSAAGVDVTLEVWDEMFHAFQIYAGMLDDAQAAIEKLGQFVRSKTSA